MSDANSVHLDLKPNWLNVARKCQYVCSQQTGFAVVHMKILVGPGGEPVFWTNPEMTNLEPKQGASVFLHQVLERLTD